MEGGTLVALDPLAPCCCPGPPRLPPRARVPAVGSPGDLSKSIINILDSFQLNSNFHKPEWSFICPDSGNVIIKDGLVAVTVVRQDELLPENISEALRRALRHHGATLFGELP